MIILLAAVVITACKKDEPEEVQGDSSSVQQLTQDDNAVEENNDEVTLDAAQILSAAGTLKSNDLPCNAFLDSVYLLNDTIHYVVRYDGLNCLQNRERHGIVIIKIHQNTQWYMPGAFLLIEFHNYQVSNVHNGNTLTINGVSMTENVYGGIIWLLGGGLVNTVTHRSTAHFFTKFNNGPARDWHLTKLQVYTGSQDNIILAINGFGNAQAYNNLLSWGTDRDGKTFYTQVTESVVFKQACDWLPHSGEQVYHIPSDDLQATAIFGYNDDNEPISGSECPTRYRLDWQQSGYSGTIYLPLTNN